MGRCSFIFTTLCVLLSGCASYKLAPDFDNIVSQIDTLGIVRPQSKIECMDVNETHSDPESNALASKNILNEELRLIGEAYPSAALIRPNVKDEMWLTDALDYLFGTLVRVRDISKVTLGGEFEEFLSKYKNRYYLFTSQYGFWRTPGSIAVGVGISVAVAIVTLGAGTVAPNMCSSAVYVALIDKQEMKPIYFNKSIQESDPRSDKSTDGQIDNLLKRLLSREENERADTKKTSFFHNEGQW
jgi:hypothetical protein